VALVILVVWPCRGKINPAYYWVLAAVIADAVGMPPQGLSPPFIALAKALTPH
jgi:hypothetical protein